MSSWYIETNSKFEIKLWVFPECSYRASKSYLHYLFDKCVYNYKPNIIFACTNMVGFATSNFLCQIYLTFWGVRFKLVINSYANIDLR